MPAVVTNRLQRVGALEKEDRIDEIKYSPPVPYFQNVSSEIFDQIRFKPACSTTEAS